MLTVFSIPRGFDGEAGDRQRAALASWARLPVAEIVLFGDDPGVAEAAASVGAVHVREIERTAFGTPLVSSAFARAHELAATPLLGYVNADIAFLGNVNGALRRVSLPRFLVAGRRLNVDPAAPPTDERAARRDGRPELPWGSDYFVFPADGTFARVPPFAVGRQGWDNWMIFHARRAGIPVVDASRAITAVHPDHGHEHIPDHTDGTWGGPESTANLRLLRADQADPSLFFHLWDATHVLTRRGVHRTARPVAIWRRYRTRRALRPTSSHA